MRAAPNSVRRDPAASTDRRRHQRVKVNLLGRCMLEDRREFACQIVDMSPGGAAVMIPAVARIGERVVAYMDHVGRIEGRVVRLLDGGFAMSLSISERKRDKLANQLTWLANRNLLNLPEDRRHERFSPRNPFSKLVLTDGTEYKCRIIDVSPSGAAVHIDRRLEVGTPVILGVMRGRVVRNFDEGVAIEFSVVHEVETLRNFFS
ncbi:MAG: PilZ domain-containing protein [Phyllobacteriaceae bacterium]|nr:PilZ domain-containing protein [Phyllobacteriaceae bacterium]